jgi:hypothetical protein
VLIPFLAGIFWFKHLRTESKTIFWLVLAGIVPQVLTAFMHQEDFLNALYNIYTPVELALVYSFFNNRPYINLFNKIRLVSVVLFVLYAVTIIALYGINHRFLNELVCMTNLCYVAWAGIFILQCALDDAEIPNRSSPLFWYLSGLILYSPATALVFSFYYSIGKNEVFKSLWVIHDIFNTAMYVFFAVGMYKDFRSGRKKERDLAYI